jgi:starch synthase
MYLRKIFQDNPLFSDSKIVLSLYNDGFKDKLDKDFVEKLIHEGLNEEDTLHYNEKSYVGIMKSAIDLCDAIIYSEEKIDPVIDKYAQESGKRILAYVEGDEYKKLYNDFYDNLLEE